MLSHVQPFATPWTVAHQAPLFMEIPRQEYWSGLLFPPAGDLRNSGIQPRSPASPVLQVDFLSWITREVPVEATPPFKVVLAGLLSMGSQSRTQLKRLSSSSSSSGKEVACQWRRHRDLGLIPGSGRSPGEGYDNPLQYSCLESPMERGAQQATFQRVTKCQTWLKQLSTQYNHLSFFLQIQ